MVFNPLGFNPPGFNQGLDAFGNTQMPQGGMPMVIR
jgi:hypothetical protein